MTEAEMDTLCDKVMVVAKRHLDGSEAAELDIQPRAVKAMISLIIATLEVLERNPIRKAMQ